MCIIKMAGPYRDSDYDILSYLVGIKTPPSSFFNQVNKQGMADRVVDDSNPEARLSSKEIQKLICDDEDDPPPYSWDLVQI